MSLAFTLFKKSLKIWDIGKFYGVLQGGYMADIQCVCKDCGVEFLFTDGEQAFYAEKGFSNQPQRCKACRQAKKQNNR